MASKKRVVKSRNNFVRETEGLKISSDWIKTAITLIVQSIAIGFYLASMKSDLGHLTDDFKGFRTRMEKEVDDLKAMSMEMIEMKAKIEILVGSKTHDDSKLEELNRDFNVLREDLQDSKRSIDNLKQNGSDPVKDLEKKLNDLKQRISDEQRTGDLIQRKLRQNAP